MNRYPNSFPDRKPRKPGYLPRFLNFRCPKEMMLWISGQALRLDISLSEVVRRIVKREIDKSKASGKGEPW